MNTSAAIADSPLRRAFGGEARDNTVFCEAILIIESIDFVGKSTQVIELAAPLDMLRRCIFKLLAQILRFTVLVLGWRFAAQLIRICKHAPSSPRRSLNVARGLSRIVERTTTDADGDEGQVVLVQRLIWSLMMARLRLGITFHRMRAV